MDALDGQPGLHSHRFCPIPDATDADRRKYLLEKLKEMPRPWTAHFHATVAVVLPSGKSHITSGQCDGEIIPKERGSNGFGYDPIFFIPEIGRTMAELEMDEKNRLSHRALAIQNAIPFLKKYSDFRVANLQVLPSRIIRDRCQKNTYQFRQAIRLLKDEHMTCSFHCL